jgi:hypothetical protein
MPFAVGAHARFAALFGHRPVAFETLAAAEANAHLHTLGKITSWANALGLPADAAGALLFSLHSTQLTDEMERK